MAKCKAGQGLPRFKVMDSQSTQLTQKSKSKIEADPWLDAIDAPR